MKAIRYSPDPRIALLLLPWLATIAQAQPRDAGEAATPPSIVSPGHAHPDYPEGGDGHRAQVELELSLDASGTVVDAELTSVDRSEPAARDLFGEAALTYVRSLRFAPATRDGSSVPARVSFRVVFDTPDPGEAQAPAGPSATGPAAPTARDAEPASTPPAGASAGQTAAPVDEPAFGANAVARLGLPPTAPAAASDFDLEIGALRDVPRLNAADYLTLAPGLVLQNHSGEGHAPTLFLRGFDAGEGQDLEVLVDGVPLNEPSNAHGHGYADSYFIIPELIQGIRVLEGPFDPRQGDFAVAGSSEYRLGTSERGVTASGRVGSFGERRMLLMWAPTNMKDQTFVGFDLRRNEGFGPERASASVSALAQYAASTGNFDWSLLLASSALQFDSAGVVRADDVQDRKLPCAADPRSQFFCTQDPNQGGSASRHLASVRLSHQSGGSTLAQQVFVSLRKQRSRENFTGYLLDPLGDGLDENTETLMLGGRGHYREEGSWLDRPQSIELGYVARYDQGRTRMWRVRAEGGAPYASVFDTDYRITNAGVYARADFRPLPRLTLTGGLRVDAFFFQLVDADRASSDRMGERLPNQAVDAVGIAPQPRGSVRVRLVDELYSVASVGLGTRSSDAQALSQGEGAPFTRVLANEIGFVYSHGERWRIEPRAFAFYTHVDDDLVFDPTRGRNVPVGSSQRFGASLVARVRGPWLDAMGSFTWSEAYLGGGAYDFSSRDRLPFVPRFVTRLDVATRHQVKVRESALDLGAALGLSYIGPKPLPLSTYSPPVSSLDGSLRAGWRFLEAAFMVQNLLDLRNHVTELNYASSFDPKETPSMRAVRHFAAGPPRTFLFTLTVHSDLVSLFEEKAE